MFQKCVLAVLFLWIFGTHAARLPGGFHHKSSFKSSGIYTIAHRGANGEFPESTSPAFKRAIAQGVDFIETDIGATKDGYLICLHDLTLDASTNVADIPEFASKKATYATYVDQQRQPVTETGFFAVDFTLEEIKTLRAKQRFGFRDQSYNGLYEILTFDEYIEIALNADRVVGLVPEIKSPTFINEHVKWSDGKIFEDKCVETLLKYGYNSSYMSAGWLEKPIFIQSFASTSILRIANQTQSPKVFNIGAAKDLAQDTLQPYSSLSSDEYLDFMSSCIVGISTDKNMVAPLDKNGWLLPPAADYIDKAHARGLQYHPAIFRNEAQFMARDFVADPYLEIDYFVNKLGVDALLTDYPLTLVNYVAKNKK